MVITEFYILIAVIALAIIFVLLLYSGKNKKTKRLSPLAILAFVFIIAGICFGDNRTIGYSFMGAGVLTAVVDIILKERASKRKR